MMQYNPSSLSVEYLDRLYAEYLEHPDRVASDWHRYFERLAAVDGKETPVSLVRTPGANGGPNLPTESLAVQGTSWDGVAPAKPCVTTDSAGASPSATIGRPGRDQGSDSVRAPSALDAARRQECVDQLIRDYRVRGHMIAQVDPLGTPRPNLPELNPQFYGLTDADLDQQFSTRSLQGSDVQTLRTVLRRLQTTYCGFIGVQFMHIQDLAEREWLQRRMEDPENRPTLSPAEQIRIFTRLTDAVIFEEFVRRKYVGAKTFSLEGAESLIPLLDLAIERADEQGIQEIVVSMAHRGRLNVLAHIIGKSPREIFEEFEDVESRLPPGRGDVKYHLGYRRTWTALSGHQIALSLCFNPSHLEFVNPVALGLVRAKQDRRGDLQREQVMPLFIHGDAAFAGEGIVQETLNLSQLAGHTTGGALHVILNNQIGFTTPPEEGRSSTYTSDVAKLLQVPIFHANGEHPEAVAQAVQVAMDFRHTFRRDVFIDMYCYRRWGHSEGDEPSFTQPLLYRQIAQRKSVRDGYLEHLMKLGEVSQEKSDEIARQRREYLEQELTQTQQHDPAPRAEVLGDLWKGYYGGTERTDDHVDTGVERQSLVAQLERLTQLPEGFHLHRKLQRWLEGRRVMARGEQPVDWATAEALAFASLAAQGYRVRLSGQDSARGTFSQRHAVLHDVENDVRYTPLQHVTPDQAAVEIVNSPLSEAGVLGFEYGYSLGFPDALVLWEAQFGDFVNAAQVLIDQFLASAEEKWQHLSGLVLLLPHGFEGQGPEHSSGRLERFLQLAAEDNLQIVVPGTPAQYFHCLRRQAIRRWRKPLIVFTPKSLLRDSRNVSTLDELATGRFRRVLPDGCSADAIPAEVPRIDRILLCSGKIYYDLRERCVHERRNDVALIRLEQLYPLPRSQLAAALEPHCDGTPIRWVQEEPENMGAWRYLRHEMGERVFGRWPLTGVCRPASGSTATGSNSRYRREQQELINSALAPITRGSALTPSVSEPRQKAAY